MSARMLENPLRDMNLDERSIQVSDLDQGFLRGCVSLVHESTLYSKVDETFPDFKEL